MTAERSPHEILWGNLQALRQALNLAADESRQEGDDEGCGARLFIEEEAAGIQRGSSLDELWASIEVLYRKTTAVAVAARDAGQPQASFAFMLSAHMLVRCLRPDLQEDEIERQVMASLAKREED